MPCDPPWIPPEEYRRPAHKNERTTGRKPSHAAGHRDQPVSWNDEASLTLRFRREREDDRCLKFGDREVCAHSPRRLEHLVTLSGCINEQLCGNGLAQSDIDNKGLGEAKYSTQV